MTGLNLRGNHYAYLNKSTKGELLELIPFNPASVRVKRDGWDLSYVVSDGGTQETFPAEKIHHVRGLSLDRFVGVSPITYNRETIGLAVAAEKHGGLTFKNGARPSGVLSFVGTLKDEVYDRVAKAWQANYGGDNRGGTAILENDAKYNPISMSNEDAQYLEVRGFQRTEICSIYRVPPHMIGDLAKSSFSNITQQSLEFAKFTVLPICKRVEAATYRDLLTRKEREQGLYVEFMIAGLERADLEQRMRSYNTGIMSGVYSPNECRRMENLDPRPGGDIYLMPLNMIDSSDGTPKPRSIEDGTPQKSIQHKSTFTKGAATREKLRAQYAPKFRTLATALVAYETGEIQQMVEAATAKGELSDELQKFYNELPASIKDRFTRLSREYAVQIRTASLAEIDSDQEIDPADLATYVDQVVATMADRHASSSAGQLNALIRDTAEDELPEIIETRLAEWEETRPAKIADRESVQQESALSRWVWVAAGITYLQWTRRGSKSCPFCTDMDGKIVGIEAPFIEKGNYTPPGSEDAAWKVTGPKMHAPLHQGCQCIITPVLG